MHYEVTVRSVPMRQLAVVQDRLLWSELSTKLIPLLDRVYLAVRSGRVVQSGQNIFVYRDGRRDGVSVAVGVEVAQPFSPVDDVVCSETPAGEVAMTTHVGPYSRLGDAHGAVISWCSEHARTRAGVWWEIYGDWEADPARLRTEVYYSVLTGG